MRANVSATQRPSEPAAPNATGACSREEPQPKFLPATMIAYGVVIPVRGDERGLIGVRARPASA